MNLYTNEDSQELLQSLDRVLPYIEYALKNNKPMFEGERYLTSEELCSILKISRRTLQYYRDDGIYLFSHSNVYAHVSHLVYRFPVPASVYGETGADDGHHLPFWFVPSHRRRLIRK